MVADDFLRLVSHRATEIPVRVQDFAGEVEFDEGERFVDRGEHALGVVAENSEVLKHGKPSISQDAAESAPRAEEIVRRQ